MTNDSNTKKIKPILYNEPKAPILPKVPLVDSLEDTINKLVDKVNVELKSNLESEQPILDRAVTFNVTRLEYIAKLSTTLKQIRDNQGK